MYKPLERVRGKLRVFSLPLWPFVPGVSETLIRMPWTSPYIAGSEQSWSPGNACTWLFILAAGFSLRRGDRRIRKAP
ncbi:hypothetical protein ABE85_07590 [Mitsuaria sp. 7]|nr:hypothetical protein ABE85_07590 [Mitsuaria sp. 7]